MLFSNPYLFINVMAPTKPLETLDPLSSIQCVSEPVVHEYYELIFFMRMSSFITLILFFIGKSRAAQMNKMLKKEHTNFVAGRIQSAANVSASTVPMPSTNMGPMGLLSGPIELAAGATSADPLPLTNMGPMGFFPGPIEFAAGASSTVSLPLTNMASIGFFPGTIELAAGATSTVSHRTQSAEYVSATQGCENATDFLQELENQQLRMRNQQLQAHMNPVIVDQPGSRSTLLPSLKRCVYYRILQGLGLVQAALTKRWM